MNVFVYICRVPRRLDTTEDPYMVVTSYGSYGVPNEPNEKLGESIQLQVLCFHCHRGLSYSLLFIFRSLVPIL